MKLTLEPAAGLHRGFRGEFVEPGVLVSLPSVCSVVESEVTSVVEVFASSDVGAKTNA